MQQSASHVEHRKEAIKDGRAEALQDPINQLQLAWSKPLEISKVMTEQLRRTHKPIELYKWNTIQMDPNGPSELKSKEAREQEGP